MVVPAGPTLRGGLPVAPFFMVARRGALALLPVRRCSFALERLLEATKSQVFQAFPQHIVKKPQFLAFF
jgi:hypothetical protein